MDIPGVEAPVASFDDVVAPVALALEQEKRVTEQINGLLRIARDESDFASEQFMQWFIKEQVEEVATMSDLLAVVTRNRTTSRTSRSTSRASRAPATPTRPRRGSPAPDALALETGRRAQELGSNGARRPTCH